MVQQSALRSLGEDLARWRGTCRTTTSDHLGGLFVGTIHAWCFRFLQLHVPRYETYDVLDDHQLQVYTDAGRREGLDVQAAYVHDLKAGVRSTVIVDDAAIGAAETAVTDAAARLRARDFTPSPGQRCRSCEVRAVCAAAMP